MAEANTGDKEKKREERRRREETNAKFNKETGDKKKFSPAAGFSIPVWLRSNGNRRTEDEVLILVPGLQIAKIDVADDVAVLAEAPDRDARDFFEALQVDDGDEGVETCVKDHREEE